MAAQGWYVTEGSTRNTGNVRDVSHVGTPGTWRGVAPGVGQNTA
jgi:hypothetical protein